MGQEKHGGKNVPKFRKIRSEVELNPKTKGQKEYIDLILSNDLTLCNGPAGSGKSLIAVGSALKLYRESNGFYKKIVVARPAITACDEDLGYLPGDIDNKMKPFMAPVVDSMEFFLDAGEVDSLFQSGVVEVIPIAFMRGRTFNQAICIFDEAQNSTPDQMRLFLTRIGFNSKVIVEGDVTQCDLKGASKQNNGLKDAMVRLDGLESVGTINLEAIDIVRSELVTRILSRY